MNRELKRKSFVFNIEWHETLLVYPSHIRYQVYDAIIEYVATGKQLSKLEPMAEMAFSFIKKELDYNLVKYEQVVAKRREAGKIGGLSKQANASKSKQNKQMLANGSKSKQTVANQAVYEYDNDNEYYHNNITPPISPSKGESMSEAEKEFERFWVMYDKKTNKVKVKAKFLKLSKADKEKIFATLQAYVDSTPDKTYRKDPLTYLNNQSWNDEIIQRNGTRQSTTPTYRQCDDLSQYRDPTRHYETVSDF